MSKHEPADRGVHGPGYWMYETSGVLRPVVERYINGIHLSREDIATMRAYLRQWIHGFRGAEVNDLMIRVEAIDDERTLNDWIHDALEAGIDPL